MVSTKQDWVRQWLRFVLLHLCGLSFQWWPAYMLQQTEKGCKCLASGMSFYSSCKWWGDATAGISCRKHSGGRRSMAKRLSSAVPGYSWSRVLLMFVADDVTSCLVPLQGSNSDDQSHHVLEKERDARGAERVSFSWWMIHNIANDSWWELNMYLCLFYCIDY